MKRKISILLALILFISAVHVFPRESMAEVEAAETNIALASNGTKASTSNPNSWAEGAGYGVANLNNGVAEEWGYFFMTAMDAGNQNKELQVSLEFKETYNVNKVRLYKVGDGVFPVDFEIRAYTKSGWKTVVTKTDYAAVSGWNEFKFDAVDCSAVVLVSTENGRAADGSYGIYLGEFEVYGTKASTTVPKPGEKPQTTTNIALASNGTKASTSNPNSWAEGAGYGVANLNNGVAEEWGYFFMTAMDAGNQNKELQVSLEFKETYNVNKVRLYKVGDGVFPVDFEIRAYTKSGWKTVVTKTDYAAVSGWNEFKFDAVDCSAVVLVSTENGRAADGSYGIYLGEFEVYGTKASTTVPKPGEKEDEKEDEKPQTTTNIALASNGTKASTSNPNNWAEGAGYGVANLNNGVAEEWGYFFMTAMDAGNQNKELQVSLVFKETYKVDKVRLYKVGDGVFPVDFEIRAYTKSGWKTVVTKTDYAAVNGWNEFKFDAVDCSAVVLVSTENGRAADGSYGIYLGEFEVYGTKASTTVPTPDIDTGKEENKTPQSNPNVGLASNGTQIYTSHPHSWGENAGYGMANLNDGVAEDGGYYFITAMDANYKNEEMKVFLVFKETYHVDTVRLYKTIDGVFPIDFEIRAYTKSGWKTVVTKKDYTAAKGWNEFKFDAVDCSAVALVTTENGQAADGLYGIYLSEFEVYGTKASTKVSAPDMSEYEFHAAVVGSNDDVSNIEKNIALYMPATARTDYAIYGFGVSNLTDGDIATMWSCNMRKAEKGTDEWVEINLLGNYSINEVVLYARGNNWGFPIDFTISIFYDGEWIEVVNETGYKSTPVNDVTAHSFKFPATIGNKIRINATNMNIADGEYGLQFMEVAAYGEPAVGDYVLPNENIVSSSVILSTATALEDYGYYTEYLTDGDVDTGYSSAQYDSPDHEEWIELDFRRTMKIGEVQLKPAWGANGFPVDFSIQAWEDGAWITAFTVKDYEKPINEAWQKFVLDRQYTTTKIRIVVTKLGEDFGQYCLKINEIEAYPYETEEGLRGAIEVVNSVRTEYAQAEVIRDSSNKMIKIAFIFGISMSALALIIGAVGGCFLLKKRIKKD